MSAPDAGRHAGRGAASVPRILWARAARAAVPLFVMTALLLLVAWLRRMSPAFGPLLLTVAGVVLLAGVAATLRALLPREGRRRRGEDRRHGDRRRG